MSFLATAPWLNLVLHLHFLYWGETLCLRTVLLRCTAASRWLLNTPNFPCIGESWQNTVPHKSHNITRLQIKTDAADSGQPSQPNIPICTRGLVEGRVGGRGWTLAGPLRCQHVAARLERQSTMTCWAMKAKWLLEVYFCFSVIVCVCVCVCMCASVIVLACVRLS